MYSSAGRLDVKVTGTPAIVVTYNAEHKRNYYSLHARPITDPNPYEKMTGLFPIQELFRALTSYTGSMLFNNLYPKTLYGS